MFMSFIFVLLRAVCSVHYPVSGLDDILLLFKVRNSLFIVSTNSGCDVVGRDFFSHYGGCLFTPLIAFFVVQKLLSFVQSAFPFFRLFSVLLNPVQKALAFASVFMCFA